MKKGIIGIMVLAMLIAVAGSAAATDGTETVSAGNEEYVIIFYADNGDAVDFTITSDVSIDVYVLDSTAFWDSDYANASYSDMGVTSSTFTFTIPDSETYYLVFDNQGSSTATVDYDFTDPALVTFEEAMDDAEGIFAMGTALCLGVLAVIVIVVVLVIFLIVRAASKNDTAPQPYPAQPAPQQTTPCTTCQAPARWVQEQNKWYCDTCGKYL